MSEDFLPEARRFEKKWNTMMDEWCYKDLESREIYLKEDFIMIRLQEETEIVNNDELPHDDREYKPSVEERRRGDYTW